MNTAHTISFARAYNDFRALATANPLHCDVIAHEIDHKPLPPIAPRTGQSPQHLLNAIIAGDLYALSRELTQPGGAPVNDPMPGLKGRTPLHVVARIYALRAGGWSAADRAAADVLNLMTQALLAAGADPCARDRDFQMPSAYTDGRTPPALCRRMEREAVDAKFDEPNGGAGAYFRFQQAHPQAKNGRCGRARAHAEATGQITGAVGARAGKAIQRKLKQGSLK